MPYTPYSLPKLPRSLCPYEQVYTDRGGKLKAKPCTKPTLVHGWCTEHAYVQELLDLAWALNFPRFVVATINNEPCYTIGSGCASWEVYVIRTNMRHAADLRRRLHEAIRKAAYSRQDSRHGLYLSKLRDDSVVGNAF